MPRLRRHGTPVSRDRAVRSLLAVALTMRATQTDQERQWYADHRDAFLDAFPPTPDRPAAFWADDDRVPDALVGPTYDLSDDMVRRRERWLRRYFYAPHQEEPEPDA